MSLKRLAAMAELLYWKMEHMPFVGHSLFSCHFVILSTLLFPFIEFCEYVNHLYSDEWQSRHKLPSMLNVSP